MPRTFSLNDAEDAPVYRGYHCSTLEWNDIAWIRSLWSADTGPIYIKGIQSVEDAYLTSRIGVKRDMFEQPWWETIGLLAFFH